MADRDDQNKNHLTLTESKIGWDWRREDPVELILLVFFIALFLLMPREHCGLTDFDAYRPSTATTAAAGDAPAKPDQGEEKEAGGRVGEAPAQP
jgi:hypothetical protein